MVVSRLEDSSVQTANRTLMSGDEALAWAALDSGARIATAYPGTPATDVQEALEKHADVAQIRCIWSVNEKVAYETALAAAISGQRAIVSMKQVGLNVAADAFMNSCPAGVNGGLLVIIGDDPECHSSQNKQDTRHYQAMSGTLLLEPCDPQEAYDMARDAFGLSERFRLPILLRLTTRTAHSCSPVSRSEPENVTREPYWPKEPGRFFIVPTVSRKLFLRLAKLQDELKDYLRTSKYFFRSDAPRSDCRVGILCSGIGFGLARELAHESMGILRVPGEPFPDSNIEHFINSHDEVFVLEEGDPLLEARALALAHHTRVNGRLSGHLKPVGELQRNEILGALFKNAARKPILSHLPLPARLPEICKPCGYHKVFGALKNIPDIATPSDIGCNSLGGLPPYEVMDGVWAMGSSIGLGCGLAAIGHKRIVCIIGDSTFFHAGLPPLVEAVHENYQLTILLLDNGTAAMTGGQGVAHRQQTPKQNSVDLTKLLEAMGVSQCTVFDPHALGIEGIQKLVEESFKLPGVKVLLYRSQCGIYTPGYGSVKAAS